MLFTTEGAADYISGVILFDETIRQHGLRRSPARRRCSRTQGIIPGIKVDKGTTPLAKSPGELVTDGLDGLRERLVEYRELGARFAKWRARDRHRRRHPDAVLHRRRTRTRSRVTPRCARKKASCRSSSPKC